ncbi:MAG: LlaJI family restriction endonuclease [bacterium]
MLGGTEADQKKDIQLLIRILSRFSGMKEKTLPQLAVQNSEAVIFPIQAYLTVLDEYYNRRSYYTENEIIYRTNNKRPANWPRTIRTKRAYPQDGSFVYLESVAKESVADSLNLITKINQFCVNEAYQKLGWLFTSQPPQRSSVIFQERKFLNALQEKLAQTNNEKNKVLFTGMINMIKYIGKKGQNARFHFGTDQFEYVWEKLIDSSFGVFNKKDYFPRTSWYLGTEGRHVMSALEPDTIMLANGKVFILDAKYYKYGCTGNPAHLPPSTSINKQITYGEYVSTESKFKDQNGVSPTVYNVFLMPYNCSDMPFQSSENMVCIGEAKGDWKISGAEYERVQGILLDVKWIMSREVRRNPKDINALAKLIESIFVKNEY